MEKIVKSGLRDCTVTLDGSECSVKFDSCFRVFAVRNDSAADVFISKASGIVPDADGVMCVKAGGSAAFAHMDIYADTVYLLGTGKVQVHAQNDTANPFNFAPTFDGGVTAEGNFIQMDNLQGGVPFSEMTVSAKNLYDNSIIVGMIAASTGEMVTTTNKYLSTNGYITVQPNQKYVLSNAENKVYDTVVFYDENKNCISSYVYGTGEIPVPRGFITPENCKYVRWRYYMDGENATVNMLTNIQLELGDTPTEYEPPITGRELVVNVSGKNLIPYPYSKPDGHIMNGVTYTLGSDKSISTSGQTVDNVSIFFLHDVKQNKLFPAGKYFISGCPKGGNGKFKVDVLDATGTKLIAEDWGDGATFELSKPEKIYLRIYFYKNANADGLTFYPQLELGTVATEYEPYHGAEYTITPDSNPYTVPDDIRQQDGYNVVSISEGELSVVGVRKNAAIKKIWDKLDELTTAVIVSNGESV